MKELQHVPVCSEILLIGHILLSINSSVNFLVYSFGNSRKIFRYLFSIFRKTMTTSEAIWYSRKKHLRLVDSTDHINGCIVRLPPCSEAGLVQPGVTVSVSWLPPTLRGCWTDAYLDHTNGACNEVSISEL